MQLWYYEHDGEQQGPVPRDELRRLTREGVVGPRTYVWTEGMESWQHAASVGGLFEQPPAHETPPAPWDKPGAEAPRAPESSAAPRADVPTHLVKAILATLFCCLPLGVVAIVYAAQVRSRLDVGDVEGASRLSKSADRWGNVAIGVGFAAIFLYLIVIVGLSL